MTQHYPAIVLIQAGAIGCFCQQNITAKTSLFFNDKKMSVDS
jgi:hypothetical protein